MDVTGKVAVVTGGAHGIGRAMALRFAREGAAGVVVADLDDEDAAGVCAEGMSITSGEQGIGAGGLCRMGVNTALFRGGEPDVEDAPMPTQVVAAAGAVLEPDDVAEVVIDALREERLLVLPHP